MESEEVRTRGTVRVGLLTRGDHEIDWRPKTPAKGDRVVDFNSIHISMHPDGQWLLSTGTTTSGVDVTLIRGVPSPVC